MVADSGWELVRVERREVWKLGDGRQESEDSRPRSMYIALRYYTLYYMQTAHLCSIWTATVFLMFWLRTHITFNMKWHDHYEDKVHAVRFHLWLFSTLLKTPFAFLCHINLSLFFTVESHQCFTDAVIVHHVSEPVEPFAADLCTVQLCNKSEEILVYY